jgi:hypothetical protein
MRVARGALPVKVCYRALAVPEPAPTPSETVQRPDGGLARGRWEAPRWAFYVAAAAALLGGIVWLAIALRTRRPAR